MEALSVKLGIFASLFGVLGLLGLAVLLASVIWLVIRVANWDSVLPALLGVLLSVAMVAGGLVLSPAPDYRPEPLKMPWERATPTAQSTISQGPAASFATA